MLWIIKNKNIFGQFYKNVYTIEYQKHCFLYIHFFIFLNLANEFLKVSYINKVICTKLPIKKSNLTSELIEIITWVMLYDLYREINLYSSFISNAWDCLLKCAKYYLYNFLEKTSI